MGLGTIRDERGGCPHCCASLQYDPYFDELQCWHCGRFLKAIHECYYDDETQEGDCYEYIYVVDGE